MFLAGFKGGFHFISFQTSINWTSNFKLYTLGFFISNGQIKAPVGINSIIPHLYLKGT